MIRHLDKVLRLAPYPFNVISRQGSSYPHYVDLEQRGWVTLLTSAKSPYRTVCISRVARLFLFGDAAC